MKRTVLVLLFSSAGAILLAQGPPVPMGGPGFGPRGGGGFGRARGMGLGPGHTVVTGHPYSGTETTTSVQTLAGGNTITHVNTAQVYRDSEGRTRIETTITPPPGSGKAPFTEIIIMDPVAGYRYLLNSSTSTAVQLPLPKASGTASGPPAPPQRPGVTITTTDLTSPSSVNGVAVTGKEVTETIGAGAIGNTNPITVTRVSYVSTELQVPVQIKTSDPRFGSSDFELTNISMGEPAASLFTVPSNYTVTTGRPGAFGRGPGAGPGFRRPPQ